MESSQSPPPVPAPAGKEPAERDPLSSLKRLLAAVAVLAAIGVGVGVYALGEAQKDEEKPDDRPLRALRVDVTALETELGARMDAVEGAQTESSAGAEGISDSLQKLGDRIDKLEKDSADDDLATQLDDLEQRVEALEDKPAR